MERVSSENLTIRPLASSNGNGSNGNMKLNSQYRHRRLTQEMRMLAEKETAARNEKTDMLREEIANAARTKQLLMQNAMERRRRRSERKFSRTILLDSITDSTIINDTLADVDSNTSSGSETISIILESAIGTKQDETSVAHRQRTNSTDKSTTLSLVAKFETKHHVDATVSSSKSIMNNKKMQPLSNGKITSTTSDQHVSNSQVASTSTTKRAAVAGAKQGVAHLIARYNTVKDDQSTTASYCKNNKTKQQQQQQQPSVAIVSENTDTNTPVDQVKSSSIASKSTLKSSLVDDTILEITELLAELNTTTASTDMIDDDTESITSVLINDHVNSPAISPTSQVEDSGIASSLDPTGISVELDMEDSIEVDTLLDSYFDGNDTASPSNVIDNAELSEILEDQHTSSILESVLDDNSDVSVSGMIEAQESTVSINIQLRKDSDAIRMINELRMLEEAEEQLRQSDLVTEQLLATARKGSVATIESLRSPRDPMLQDNSIISLSSYYDADLILNNSSVAVYDIRKSMRLEFNSNDVNGLLLSDKMPHPSRLSSDQSNDPSRSSNGSNSNSRLYMVDRHLLNHAGRLKSVTPVTAIKSELNLLVNDLFPTSTVSPSTVVPPPRYPTSSSSSAHTAISPSTASLGSSLSTTSTIASSSDMMVIDTRSGRTRKPASILSPLSDSSISVASMAEHRSSIIHNRHESPSEHGINTATAVTSSTKYESNISMSNATATESNNPIALMNDIPAIPLRSAPTIITVSAPLVPSEERIPDKTLAIIDPNAKPFASLDLQDTNRQLPPTNTKTEEGLTSPRKGMAAASRAESRRQRRKSGVAGTPDGRWSARSSRGQKSDTAQPASSDNNHLDDSQPDTYVAEEFRQILGQHLSNILTEELTDTNALEIDNGGSSSTLPNPHPSSLSDSDAAIRIVAVQGQKARIIFNEKPAPPPGQRPIITKSRGSPLSNDNPAPRIQPTFSTTSPLHRQSKHTIAPHLFNTAPPRHSRSSSFPSMDLCSVTMDSAISTSSPGATTPSTPSALCPRNMPAHKQLHRKSSSLSMSHIQYTNGAVNNAMFQREQHSLLAKSNAIRNNINTASTMQAESLVNGINNTGKASAVSSTITDANSTKTNTTVLHTRAPSESTIAKSIPISHQRSHSQPIIHSINHIERIASPVHRSSSSSSSSSTAQPALLQKSNTTLPTNRVSTTTTTSDKPQTSWENLPPWNQLYWSSNNGSNNDDSDADTSNRTISDTASSSKQQRQQQRQRQHSIEQQLKDDSIPMTSSMNTMLETASSPSTSPSLTSNPLQAMRRQPSTRAKALAESLSVGARTNSLAGTTATSIVETNKSTIHRPINTVSPTSENSPLVILTTYLKHFDFAETSIDLALRALLLDIPLPRQPEKIDCILVAFSNRFYECNPDMFSSVDAVYSTGFAMLLLHVDTHGMDARHMITFEQFVNQANSIDKTRPVAQELLEILYDNVLTLKFSHASEPHGNCNSTSCNDKHHRATGHHGNENHGNLLGRFLGRHRQHGTQATKSPQRFLQQTNKAKLAAQIRVPSAQQYTYKPGNRVWPMSQELLKKRCTLRVSGVKQSLASTIGNHPTEYSLALAPHHTTQYDEHHTSTVELLCNHQDFVFRKLDQVENGQRSGQRSWIPYWLILCGSQLLLFTEVAWFRDMEIRGGTVVNEQGVTHMYQGTALPPAEIHSLKDAICIIDSTYTKYPYTIRLCLADGQQWLLRTNDEEAMAQWMFHINHAAVYRSIKLDLIPRSCNDRNELRLRRNIITGHLTSIASRLATVEDRINADTRLFHQLSVSVPIRRKIRDRAIAAGRALDTRLRKTYIEQQQLQCYREILSLECNSVILELK